MSYKNMVWSVKDFSKMNWHDSSIHSINLFNDIVKNENVLLFDIDYLLEWKFNSSTNFFLFSILPCNLYFYDVHNLQLDIDTGNVTTLNLEIDYIESEVLIKTEDYKCNKWLIELQNGTISFEAKSFKMIAMNEDPIISKHQKLSRTTPTFYYGNPESK